ncbi:MAG: ABC transporter permease subunit, partial [Bacilli bacterium]
MLIGNIVNLWSNICDFFVRIFVPIINFFVVIWKITHNYFPLLCKGLGITLLLSLITVLCGAVLGLFIYLLANSKLKILKFLGNAYIEIIRGIPLLLQLLAIYIMLPNTFTKFTAA